jgi:hypothetical protein
MFSFKHTQLLAESKNLETEIVSRTEKGTEKAEYWEHGLGFISYLTRSGASAKSMIPHNYGVLATNRILFVIIFIYVTVDLGRVREQKMAA